jgi:hypothetical protein
VEVQPPAMVGPQLGRAGGQGQAKLARELAQPVVPMRDAAQAETDVQQRGAGHA